MRTVRRVVGVMVLAAVLAGSGCAPTVAGPALSASISQPRSDIPFGRIVIRIANEDTVPVTITSASLTSSLFTDDLAWAPDDDATTIPAGRAVELRVDLQDMRCDTGDPTPTVGIAWSADGEEGRLEIEPTDPYDFVPVSLERTCFRSAVEEVAVIRSDRLEGGGLGEPAELVVVIEPTGGDGTMTIDGVAGTTLMSPWDDGRVNELPLDLTVDADGPRELRIPLVSARCDPHALAEDKVGANIPLLVTTRDGQSDRLVLTASDLVRGQLQKFFGVYCGF